MKAVKSPLYTVQIYIRAHHCLRLPLTQGLSAHAVYHITKMHLTTEVLPGVPFCIGSIPARMAQCRAYGGHGMECSICLTMPVLLTALYN